MPNVVILSDGCQPTEDIYLMRSAASYLESRQKVRFEVVNCRKKSPAEKYLGNGNYFLVAFRTLPENWIQFLEKHKASRKLVYVLDDDLKAASETPELPEKYRSRISYFAANQFDRLLRLSDQLVVTSTHLMHRYQNHNPLRLNPTALRLPDSTANFDKAKLSIAYHATSSHKSDLAKIQEPLIKTLDVYNCTFESLIGKQTPDKLAKHPSTKIKSPKSYAGFRRFQALTARNICLAPLFETPYNKGKSWIKFMDASAVGSVGIYSNREPYTEIVTHGVNGMLADDDPEAWQNCLSYLLENPEKAKIMAENALQRAREIGSFKHAYRFWHKQFLR